MIFYYRLLTSTYILLQRKKNNMPLIYQITSDSHQLTTQPMPVRYSKTGGKAKFLRICIEP